MNINQRIEAFVALGIQLRSIAGSTDILTKAYQQNNWFTENNVVQAANVWADTLSKDNIEKWLKNYGDKLEKGSGKRVGVINAGNIPFVGLHDFISILISGNQYIGKNASDDSVLLPHLAEMLCEIEPRFTEATQFTDRLTAPDAVIATGSNNTSRYFEYYFSKYPHIIRKNRNAVAVLTGMESKDELQELGKDVFQYFGLGCRNVSKLYVPRGYIFDSFFEAMFPFSELMQHNKYMNNFDYNNAMLLLKKIPFLQNGFLIIREESRIASPIAVLHYEYYDSVKEVEEKLKSEKDNIQCIVSTSPLAVESPIVKPGNTQSPSLWDYADGVNTMEFLLSI